MKSQSIAPANPHDPPEGSDVRLRNFGGVSMAIHCRDDAARVAGTTTNEI